MPFEEPIDGLLATPPGRLPFGADIEVRAFLLTRPRGNLIVYNAPGLASVASELPALGGAVGQFINHGHEAMFDHAELEAPIFVHELDRAEASRTLPIERGLVDREKIDEDFDVIPIPGHTPGSTAFLWDSGNHRFLFTGDSIWLDHGEWAAVVLDPRGRADYLRSLALMRRLEFDVLVPWGATDGEPYVDLVDQDEAHERIDLIIARVETGSAR
jgi:glyoxylase-like metal-dependent hydrolase (beta-lactamase superfamily II)